MMQSKSLPKKIEKSRAHPLRKAFLKQVQKDRKIIRYILHSARIFPQYNRFPEPRGDGGLNMYLFHDFFALFKQIGPIRKEVRNRQESNPHSQSRGDGGLSGTCIFLKYFCTFQTNRINQKAS